MLPLLADLGQTAVRHRTPPASGHCRVPGLTAEEVDSRQPTGNQSDGSGTTGIDLVGDFTAAHIHNVDTSIFAPLSNTQFPVGSTKSGVLIGNVGYSASPSAVTELTHGMQYVNVHSTFKPGGEIYGNLISTIAPATTVSEPSTIALLSLGVSGLLAFRRRD